MTIKIEDLFLVLKLEDVYGALSGKQLHMLKLIVDRINAYKDEQNKPDLRCVVVEEDWPEYEQIWTMLDERLNNPTSGTNQ
jgi:2-methylisocitrate lyase-like PEP mutase family enzyme